MSWFADFAGKAEHFLNKVDQGAATALSKNQDRTSYSLESYEGDSTDSSVYSGTGYKADTAETQHAYAPSYEASSYISAVAGNIKRSNATLLAGTANVSSSTSLGSASTAPSTVKASSSFVRRKKSEQDVNDDLLFDFLNSSDPPASDRKEVRREPLKVSVPVAEVQNPTPPPSVAPLTIPSAPSTPPSTRGVSRTSSISSLSAHSIKTSEDGSARDQSQGMPASGLTAHFYLIS